MIQKIMTMSRPSDGLMRLFHSGRLQVLLPELCALNDVADNGINTHKNNFVHSLQVLDNVAAITDDLDVRWAALLHDVGKGVTREWDAVHGWTFRGHDIKGAAMANGILRRLGLTGQVCVGKVCKLIRMHMTPGILDGVTDAAVTRFRAVACDIMPELLLLARADVTTKHERVAAEVLERYARLETRIHDLDRAECNPEYDATTCEIILNGGRPAVTHHASLESLRNRYGRFVISSRKHKGAGKGVKLNYRWEWEDYPAFISDLRICQPTEYAFIRLNCLRWIYKTTGGDISEYRANIKAVRREYGLSKKSVEQYLKV